ncbi:M20 family metallo-hydrolase [Bacteroides sp. Marseille-P3684]|uniref:M20 family metallo-hydrolase n=1 Tax=Bacteroides sp. Marseille-P3684 TaxID=2086579 RepID=UPI000D0AF3D0|nr:M20 family metallo-hydrolase [Bacteroides sp. Marseille-P3684]
MDKEAMLSEALNLLKVLISTPSMSREEEAAANALQNYMERSGILTNRSGNNVWCVSPQFSLDKPTLLLNSHIDTVKPVSGWQKQPFTPTEVNGKLYGLGSNDAGGSLVCLFQTFCRLTRKEQPYNLIFLASCEEEVSGKNGIESVLPKLPPIALGIVGEPTEMQPAIAEKGLMVLDVTAHGKAGHAAREEGDNAIYHALTDIEWFRTYRFERVSPLLGPVKMSVTQINAGTQHNVIPDRCSFVVDIRSNELYTNEELFSLISQHVSSEVTARSFRLNSSHIDASHPVVRRAVELGRTPYGSPTLSDQALMPFPSVKIGPGKSSRSHTANEYILIRELEEALDLYYELLDGLVIG